MNASDWIGLYGATLATYLAYLEWKKRRETGPKIEFDLRDGGGCFSHPVVSVCNVGNETTTLLRLNANLMKLPHGNRKIWFDTYRNERWFFVDDGPSLRAVAPGESCACGIVFNLPSDRIEAKDTLTLEIRCVFSHDPKKVYTETFEILTYSYLNLQNSTAQNNHK